MLSRLSLILLTVSLCSCAAMPQLLGVIFGDTSQRITKTPIWLYKPDLFIQAGTGAFFGVGDAVLTNENTIQIQSLVNINRVEISTCSRHDVCQIKGGDLACNPLRFYVEKGFFGGAGKTMTYTFVPDATEKNQDTCPNILIEVYDNKVLAAWGYVVYQQTPKKNFEATMTCNATDRTRDISVCSAKAGTIQEINFAEPVDNFRAEPTCRIKKISDKQFQLKPEMGWCRASFARGQKWHDVILNGYDEVLLR